MLTISCIIIAIIIFAIVYVITEKLSINNHKKNQNYKAKK